MVDIDSYPNVINFNVGGQILPIDKRKITQHCSNSCKLIWLVDPTNANQVMKDENENYFLDRDPYIYRAIFNYLRTDKNFNFILRKLPIEAIYREAHYLRFDALVEDINEFRLGNNFKHRAQWVKLNSRIRNFEGVFKRLYQQCAVFLEKNGLANFLSDQTVTGLGISNVDLWLDYGLVGASNSSDEIEEIRNSLMTAQRNAQKMINVIKFPVQTSHSYDMCSWKLLTQQVVSALKADGYRIRFIEKKSYPFFGFRVSNIREAEKDDGHCMILSKMEREIGNFGNYLEGFNQVFEKLCSPAFIQMLSKISEVSNNPRS
ncbi:unnamed protein product [Gordionus sp. m RMFG-2023]